MSRLTETAKGNLWLGSGALGIMGMTGAHLIYDVPLWNFGFSTVLWWLGMAAAGLALWIGVCKTTC